MRIRSLIFNILIFLWVGIVIGVALFLIPLPERYFLRWIQLWSQGCLVLCRTLVGITYEVRGQEFLREGAIIACRHESFWETTVFHALVPKPRYVLKKQLTDIPLYGYVLKKLGSLSIDRDKGARSITLLMRNTQKALAEGGTLVIFPEGTRMPKNRVGILKPGVYVLYRAAQKPVIPAMVNSGSFWPRRGFLKRPGHIILSFLPPIPPGLDKDAFMKRLQHTFEEEHRHYVQQGWTF